MTDETLLADNAAETADTEVANAASGENAGAGNAEAASADDWRARISGGDEKLMGFLGRIPSEKALVEQVKKHNDDLKGGKYLKPLPENPTDEEVTAWRKATGVPEKFEDYHSALPDGLIVGEEDKPYVDKFMENMFGANAPPALVNAALETYYGILEDQASAEVAAAKAAESSSIELLREEWGPEYKRNLNVMHGYLDTLPEPVADAFRHGRGADGIPLGYNPDVLRWLAAQALEANPVATVVPGAGANQASAIADEIINIEKLMGNRQSTYWKGPEAAKLQARYLELVTARDRIKGA